MADKQLQTAKHGVFPAQAQGQSHIKIRVPIALRIVLPLAATIIMFQGCSGNTQKETKSKGGEPVLVYQTGIFNTPTNPRDTLVAKADRLDSLKLEVASRDSVLTSRMLQEMDKKTVFSPKGTKRPALDKEDMRKHLILSDFSLAIDQLKQNNSSKAKEYLASAESKMTVEEKKTDSIYLQLKTMVSTEQDSTKGRTEFVKTDGKELDSLRAEVMKRIRSLHNISGEGMLQAIILNGLTNTIDYLKEGDIAKAKESLSDTKNMMSDDEEKTNQIYLRLKALIGN